MGIRLKGTFRLPGGSRLSNPKVRKRLIAAVVVFLVVVGASTGAYMYVQQKRHSLPYAIEKLNEAIVLGDLTALSTWVDFSVLSRDVVEAWSKVAPDKAPKTGIERRELEDAVQSELHDLFTSTRAGEKESAEKGEEKKEGAAPDKESTPPDKLAVVIPSTPPMFPLDFAAQLAATPFRLVGQDGDFALVASRIHHPDLGLNLPVQLLVAKKDGNWRFGNLVNADQLVSEQQKADQNFRMRREALFYSRNADIRVMMNRHSYITGCAVGVAKVEKDGTVLIFLTIEGANTGEEVLRSSGVRCQIRDRKGKLIKDVALNLARRVEPEQAFSQYWNFQFEAGSADAGALINGGPLTCTTSVMSVSLENGKLIYPRPFFELEEKPAGKATEKPK